MLGKLGMHVWKRQEQCVQIKDHRNMCSQRVFVCCALCTVCSVTLQQVWGWYCSWTGASRGSSSSLTAGGAAGLDRLLVGGTGEVEGEGLWRGKSAGSASPVQVNRNQSVAIPPEASRVSE